MLTIARVELLRFLRERSNIFFVFVLPLGLVLFIGLQFGDMSGAQLGVVASDDPAANELVERLEDRDGLSTVDVEDSEELESLVSRANLPAGIVIPDGYGSALTRAESIEIGFIGRPDTSAASLRTLVESTIADQSAASAAARSVSSAIGDDPQQLVAAANEARATIIPMSIETEAVGGDALAAEFASMGRFDLGATSQLFLFVFLTSLAGSASLIQTRQYGIATRMLSTPTRLPIVMTGLAGGRFAIAAFQAVYIMLVTGVAFGVDWGDPVATGTLVLLFCVVSAAAAMVLGALFRNDSQASGAGVGLGLVMAALGGSMVPLDVFPEGVSVVARFTPHGWANMAMAEITRRDGSLFDIATEVAVLAAIAVVLVLIATWLLRRAITR